MTGLRTIMVLLGLCVVATGCQGTADNPAVPSGPAAYSAIPLTAERGEDDVGLLRAGDSLAIRVMDEPDLSLDKVTIGEDGTIQMPLVGSIQAAGLTASRLSAELTERLGARYLRNPRLAVNVIERQDRTITVEGEVHRPGIYPVEGKLTLLGALAAAQSPTQLAKPDEIFVFREVNGQRMAARFDVRQLRSGLAPDPEIVPGDTVVVGFSAARSAYQDFLRATPLLNIFTVF